MADDEDISLDDGAGSAGSGKKGGKLAGLFSGFLKWIIIGIVAIVAVVTISLVTANIVASNKVKSIPTNAASDDYSTGKREIYDWYTSLGMIQTQTADEPPATVRVDLALGYTKDDKKTSTEITQQTIPIKAFLRRYFSSKTAAELKNANNEDALAIEIKNGINDKILSDSKIRDISFQQKDVVVQY